MRLPLGMIMLAAMALCTAGCDVELPENNRQVAPEQFGVTTDTAETAAQHDPSESDPGEDVTIQEAGVGAMGKGEGYGDDPLTYALPAYWSIQERLTFESEVPKAVQIYETMNNKKVESTKEFMEQVIKPNHIKLPELPEGQKYMWSSKNHKLMIVKPKK